MAFIESDIGKRVLAAALIFGLWPALSAAGLWACLRAFDTVVWEGEWPLFPTPDFLLAAVSVLTFAAALSKWFYRSLTTGPPPN